jgi:hypothetical protein
LRKSRGKTEKNCIFFLIQNFFIRKIGPTKADFLYLKPILKPGKLYPYNKKSNSHAKRIPAMKSKLAFLASSAQKINRQHVQLVLVIISLALLVLGAGAPADGGGGW